MNGARTVLSVPRAARWGFRRLLRKRARRLGGSVSARVPLRGAACPAYRALSVRRGPTTPFSPAPVPPSDRSTDVAAIRSSDPIASPRDLAGLLRPRPRPQHTPPAIEPTPRRRLVQRGRARAPPIPLCPVLARIQQDVPKRIPHLGRRLQHAHVVAPEQHGSPPPEHPVHRPGDPSRDRLHPNPERPPVRGFDQEMEMGVLHGVVHDAERALIAGLAQAAAEVGEESLGPQAATCSGDPPSTASGTPPASPGPVRAPATRTPAARAASKWR